MKKTIAIIIPALITLLLIIFFTVYLIKVPGHETVSEPDVDPIIHKSSPSETITYVKKDPVIKLKAQLGNDQIRVDQGTAYLLIELEALDQNQTRSEQPVNIAFVLDKSGSMSGKKIQYLKQAMKTIPSLLDQRDRISIHTYNEEVEELLPSRNFNAAEFDQAVNSINTSGSTNLEGGLIAGIESCNKNSNEFLSRVILLSDGLANIGLSKPEQLSELAESKINQDSTISTIGIGADFDEDIMTSIAKTGRGNYYFLEDPDQALDIFNQELTSLLSVQAENLKLDFNLNKEHFQINRAIGYELEQKDYFNPYNLYSGRKVSYLFEIKSLTDQQSQLETLRLANLELEYFATNSQKNQKIELPINIELTDQEINPLSEVDIYREFIKSHIAEKLWQVDQKLDQVENSQALYITQELIKDVKKANQRLDGELDTELNNLEKKAQQIEELGSEDVKKSYQGRIFKKSNQSESYEKIYNK
ncbi:MAG: VWA domain-containing protein [Candidatus Moranbacteria bacterium]|nr:VWA domain-containing protein [Candidatus Moranbacteria bacterium]